MQINRRLATALLMLILILQGCATLKPDRQTEAQLLPEIREKIDLLLTNESFEAAAALLQTVAQQSESPLREQLYLEAAETWLKAGYMENSLSLIDKLQPPTSDDPAFAFRLRMLRTEIAILRGDIEQALDLMEPSPGEETPIPLRLRYHANMAEIFRLSGNLLESARELNVMDLLLADDEVQRLEIQELLVQTLASMTDTALQLLQPPPPSNMGGWMELARLVKQQIAQPADLATALATWRERFSDHPALQAFLASLLERRGLSSSDHIAILLPQSGPYKNVATAVRDGFMAAWYQHPLEYRPQLRFYDSSKLEDTLRTYQQALLQGAQMVVGPLNKNAVNMLLQMETMQQPVLALNQVEDKTLYHPNLFQFGLAPEDEAEQIAERAWLEGHQQALILTPAGGWGDRIAENFRLRWQTLGGAVLEQRQYNASENDFSHPIRQLLNIDESQARIRALEQLLGKKLESEFRRRQDADFIFLAARPQKGRQLRPQLRFHHAGSLPIYTTSHIYSGVKDDEKDRDLGRISFVDTPWLLEDETQNNLSRTNLQRLMPGVGGQYARLYAMGIDSYNLLASLQQLQAQPGRTISGKTGTLYLDRYNRLHRLLAWADMKAGSASITGYAPRMQTPTFGQPTQSESALPNTPNERQTPFLDQATKP
ncbi:MAG: penicillin-binding protein activator [Candidatus Thiodiazotropha sp. (ex Myrtea sp. 'scaly one' KF741663)]|nr:penicillin-binding protein activator [Candidatus Thiodiazotropha sp. (ex Myrtea sp. 'scaly one' KF741663)]